MCISFVFSLKIIDEFQKFLHLQGTLISGRTFKSWELRKRELSV